MNAFLRPTIQGRERPDNGIESPWGWRELNGHTVFHHGQDYYWVIGDPSSYNLYGVTTGVVLAVETSPTMGLEVTIQVSPELRVRYSHLEFSNVSIGTSVTTSTLVGVMGSSGSQAGGERHLHFEVWVLDGDQWVRTDPEPYFQEPPVEQRKEKYMIPLLINDGRNKLGGGTRTYVFGSGLWLETTGMPTANAVSVLLIGNQSTPNLTYAELYEYAKASNALTPAQLEPYRKAAGK